MGGRSATGELADGIDLSARKNIENRGCIKSSWQSTLGAEPARDTKLPL